MSVRYFIFHKSLKLAWSVIRAVIIFGVCFVILYPLFLKFSVSVMAEKDLYDSTVRYIARNITLNNYSLVWNHLDYPTTFARTALMSFTVGVLQLVSCILTAYGFARFKFPLKNLLFGCVLLTLIVPPQILMLPMFMYFRYFDLFGIFTATTGGTINLLDGLWPYVILSLTTMGFKNGLYIYMLRQYFKGVPKELEEAAYVDGCGRLRTFIRIMLPSAIPMTVTVFLFGFVWQWTDSFYSSLFLTKYKILPVALTNLGKDLAAVTNSNVFASEAEMISPGFVSMMNNTGIVLAIIPLIILYLICQRNFVESIERSGIVG